MTSRGRACAGAMLGPPIFIEPAATTLVRVPGSDACMRAGRVLG